MTCSSFLNAIRELHSRSYLHTHFLGFLKGNVKGPVVTPFVGSVRFLDHSQISSLTSGPCRFRMLSSQQDIAKEATDSLCSSSWEQPTLNSLRSPSFLLIVSPHSYICAGFWVTGMFHTLPRQGDPCLEGAFPSASGFLFLKDHCT